MKEKEQASDVLQMKPHFEILDGLRGVAAVAVLCFHFMEFAIPDYTRVYIAHSYLAVDFFFCLSGFVIAYAYDNRIKSIGRKKFFLLRLIRLQPLVVIGAALGLLTFVLDPMHNLFQTYGLGKTILMFVSASCMIPYAVVSERYRNLFHFNPPSWSLFWEYIANIFYAVILFKLHKNILVFIAILAAAMLCYTAHQYSHLCVGWGIENFFGGGARIFYSFIIGMIIYRANWIIKSSTGFIGLTVLLLIAFLVPYVNELNWLTDPLIVIFYFPLLVALGAGARPGPQLKKICQLSGEISYPLYMVHYPFIWLFLSYVEKYQPSLSKMAIVMSFGVVLIIGFAFLILRYVDIPIRTYLTKQLKLRY